VSREEPRRCKKCGYQWWAVKAGKPAKLRWSDDGGFPFLPGQATARSVRLGHRKSEQIREWERYGLCARCGSQSIATVRSKGFVPTALAEARAPGDGPAPAPAPAAAPGPAAPPPAPGHSSGADQAGMRPGDWVTVDQFGFRGKHGRIEAVRLDGTFDVRLAEGGLVLKRVAAKNLTRRQPGTEDSSPSAAAGGFRLGDRVTVHVLGFRGKTGTVETIRPDGSCDVRLDSPRTLVKRIPASKLSGSADT
jgi:hypothetical protein